jgi:hypothetical protein
MSLQFSHFSNSDLEHISLILGLYSKRKISDLGDYFGYLYEIDKNNNSGIIYMVDDEGYVLVYNKSIKKLDLWITLPDSGLEGFYNDLVSIDEKLSADDKHFLRCLD